MPEPEEIIQHTPTDGKPGEVFHPPGTVKQLPDGKRYRLTDKGWELDHQPGFEAPGAIKEMNGKKYRLTEKGWELIDETNPPAA